MKLTLAVDHQTDPAARTITGRIAVYGQMTDDGRRIILAPGAIEVPTELARLKLLLDHDMTRPVGYCTSYDPDTLTATFHVPAGPDGDLALQHADSGLRDGLSIGMSYDVDDVQIDDEEGTATFTRVRVVEVSLVSTPAYGDARVSGVTMTHTDKEPEMPDTTLTAEALDERLQTFAAEQAQHLAAALDELRHDEPAGSALPAFQTFGHYVKAVAGGDQAALDFHAQAGQLLAYDGAKTSDGHPVPTWIADAIRLVERKRRVIGFFGTSPLPAQGMSVEYMRLRSDGTKIAKQAKEGDNLQQGKIEFESKTVQIETYGGWTEYTRQIVDRMPASYLTTLFRAMAMRYGRVTEAAALEVLKAEIAGQASPTITLQDSATADDWLAALVDAVQAYEDTDYTPEGMLVSTDIFKYLLGLTSTGGQRLMSVVAPIDGRQVGRIDVPGLSGDLAGVTVHLMPGLAAKSVALADPAALTVWESPGAPFQLQDENIVNLTKSFSLYGYLAAASQHPGGLLRIKVGA